MKKKKLFAAVAIVAVLALAFYFGGGAPGSRGWTVENAPAASNVDSAAPSAAASTPEQGEPADSAPEHEEEPAPDASSAPEHAQEPDAGAAAAPVDSNVEINPDTGKDAYQTEPVSEGKPAPVEPQEAEVSDAALTCTLSISCATILDNMALCDPEKVELVPADGWLLEPLTVTFYEGENVFNVLQRTCKQQKIHMEYEDTPIYNSAYIEGIGNLYEFDVGEKSGWMYKVNGWFPNYGCSRYQLEDGDEVCWVYTCDLGADVGDNSMTG